MVVHLWPIPHTESGRIGRFDPDYSLNQVELCSFAKVQGGTCCRFLFAQHMIFSYISWEMLCEQVKVKALMQMQIEPHINKPLGASQVADRLTEQEFLGHLMEKMVSSAKQVSTGGNWPPLASLSAADR